MAGIATTKRVILYQRGIWQTWAATLLPLLYCWLWLHDWRKPITWHSVGKLVLYLGTASLLGLMLKQLLKPEPLAVEVDYRAGLVTCYQPGIRWKTTLPLVDARCQLSLPKQIPRGSNLPNQKLE